MHLTTLSFVTIAAAALASLAPAGPLDPPSGPIAPTGRTLAEVEPRTPISDATTPGSGLAKFVITQPGSYYLTGNIIGESGKNGITIATSNVTLDLCGFAMIGVPGSLDGVSAPGFVENVVIRNGHVRAWGGSGIETRIDIGCIEGITASSNAGWGINNAGGGTYTTSITRCQAFRNGLAVADTGNIRGADNSTIYWCISYDATGSGIVVGASCTIDSCTVYECSGNGISALNGCIIRNNVSSFNAANGIVIGGDSIVANNLCRLNGAGPGDGAGIVVTGADSRIEANVCTDADRGIDVDFTGNFIARNICSGNTVNWDIAAGNICFVVNATASPAFSGSAGGNPPGSTDPNANFSY